MTTFTKPVTWIVLVALFAAGMVFAVKNFTKAMPTVNLRVTMPGNQALDQARSAAKKLGLGPSNALCAAMFDGDSRLQTFVELEGGGKDAFAAMLQGDLVSPYVWRVRLFQEHEVNETEIRFTPLGRLYGFREKISENAPGATLEPADARRIAETAAVADWAIELDPYALVESSTEVRPAGRTDHAFTYERTKESVGDGRYRLRLTVSGDRLTELTRFVKIPEAFDRRYEQMRSANNTIATVDMGIVYVVYFGAGCCVGLFFLLKRRSVLWRKALFFGAGIGVLQILASLNELPLMWMSYNTAESRSVFLNGILASLLTNFLLSAVLLTLIFMAAESLTRKAFPHLVQFWRVWQTGVANSAGIAGQTLGAYLLVGFLIAYDVAVYLVGNGVLGWWTPSDTVIDPNIIAMVVPWLNPFVNAFQAGFSEECLFRAVPLSCAALIGARFGRRKLLLAVALVAQAVVFGAAHANYPQQPAYARIVEIAPAFLVFGLIYLRFGLLPVIVAHFAVDLFYMSIPLFLTDVPGIWISRAMAILLLAAPLLIVLIRTASRRGWTPVSPDSLNAAWQAAPAPVSCETGQAIPPRAFTRNEVRLALGIGMAGVAAWAFLSDFASTRLDIDRHAARVMAGQVWEERGLAQPPGDWILTTGLRDLPGQADRYVWQTRDPEIYRSLQEQGYLSKPAWTVRRVTFSDRIGVADRAETFGVVLSGTGTVERVSHALPEGRNGKTLTRDEGRALALRFLKDDFRQDGGQLKEIEAKPTRHPNRVDWNFVFVRTNFAAFTNDEIRIGVALADGAVVEASRYVHVPESWSMDEQALLGRLSIIRTVCSGLVMLLFFAGLIVGMIRWARGDFAIGLAAVMAGLIVMCRVAGGALDWPSELFGYSTAESFRNQTIQSLATLFISVLFIGPLVGILAGASLSTRTGAPGTGRRGLLLAIGGGLGLAGIVAVMEWIAPKWAPFRLDYTAANAVVPVLDIVISSVPLFVIRSVFMLWIVSSLNRWAGGGPARRRAVFLLMVLVGVLLAGRNGVVGIGHWLEQGVSMGLGLAVLNAFVFRRALALVPVSCAAAMAPGLLRQAIGNAHPGAALGHALGILAIAWLAGWWFRRLESSRERS